MTKILFRHEVTQKIRIAILNGKYPPGERLAVEKLAKEFGVSHTPVLAALVALEQEGLLVSIPHRGAFVRSFNDDEIVVLLRVIGVNEALAACIGAQRIDSRELREMKDLHAKALANPDISTKEFQAYDRKFHSKIVQSSHTDVLIDLLEKHLSQFYLSRYYIGRSQEWIQKSLAEHAKIIDALEKHDPELAEKVVKQHIESAIQSLRVTME